MSVQGPCPSPMCSTVETDDTSAESSLLKRRGSRTIVETMKRATASASADKIPTLDELKRAIPPQCFQKSLLRSLAWAALDIAVVLTSLTLYTRFLTTEHSMPVFWAVTLVYWNVVGLYMWSLFVVGHDCGHSTFSAHPLVNDTVGFLIHSAILTPYFSWQESHNRHHMYHNSELNDYSHFWVTERREEEVKALHPLHRTILTNSFVRCTFAPLLWWGYLLCGADDCHFTTIGAQRMWKNAGNTMVIKCHVSTIGVVAGAYAWWVFLGRDAYVYSFAYVVPEIFFGMWLLLVTYLQHHQPDVQVYDVGTWSFVRGAFETIDRRYGFGLDLMGHHISDCHLVHHLFFRQIPHYHLREATDALEGYLHKNGYGHLYKTDDTGFFLFNFFGQLWNGGFRARLVKTARRAA